MDRLRMFDRPVLFFTGATGLVGKAVVAKLRAALPEVSIVGITRRPPASSEIADHVSMIEGDLGQPQFGLAPEIYSRLKSTVTGIFHAAADIRFELPLEDARQNNVTTTLNVLQFARECPLLQKLGYVSTLYVNGLAHGRFPELPITGVDSFANSYQQSKYEAETAVWDAARHLPIVIYRLSSIVADDTSGTVSQFNYFHLILRCVLTNSIPALPGRPEAPLDFVCNEWVADSLAYLFQHRFQPGTIRHLCSGPKLSMCLAEAMELNGAILRSRFPQNRSVRLPEITSPAEYRSRLAAMETGGRRELMTALDRFMPLLDVPSYYENAAATAELESAGLPCPDIRTYYARIVDYCFRTNWGKRPKSA